MKEEAVRLNPFVYISETDVRFYLLVLIGIIVPSSYALFYGVSISFLLGKLEITFLLRSFITVVIFSLIPLFIYWNYRGFSKKITEESRLKEFSPEKFPDHCEYIGKLYGEYLSTVKQPTLMYEPFDLSESAFTFGTRKHTYIGMSGGLIRRFRKNIDDFRSVFLHEMGHIVNKDVEKTYLASSTLRSLWLTLSIPLFSYLLAFLIPVFYQGILAGYDVGYLILDCLSYVGSDILGVGGIILYFLLLWVIVYVLRNQIIRLREFYADAKVLEWEESPKAIVKTLGVSGSRQYSKFEILTKFHPNINERIDVLKNSSSLFTPSLWVAFAVGFFYIVVLGELSSLYTTIFSDLYWESLFTYDIQYQLPPSTVRQALISVVVFPILMLAVASGFHKSILKDAFVDNTQYFSNATILNAIKYSLAFSLAFTFSTRLISFPSWKYFSLYEDTRSFFSNATVFLTALVFLSIFASMLVPRSFTEKEAKKNFLMIASLSSFLYIANRFIAAKMLSNKPVMIVFFFVFSIVTYALVKLKDRQLCCPNCNSKISNLSGLKLDCPNCHHNLYSWAIYSFSSNSVDRSIETAKEIPIKEKWKPKGKIIMASLLVVVATSAVSLWGDTEYTPFPPIGLEYETYSKYGFSFEYPEMMTFEEQGLLEDTATNGSGMLSGLKRGVSKDEVTEIIFVNWMKSAVALPLRSELESGLAMVETMERTTDFEIGELVETAKAGHEMIYQNYTVTFTEEDVYYGVYGVWYCDDNQRLYHLHFMYGKEDAVSTFWKYLDSFVCHQ